MIRHCDGNDPNLLRDDWSEGQDEMGYAKAGYKPCDCGKMFDDVNHLTIFPHYKF